MKALRLCNLKFLWLWSAKRSGERSPLSTLGAAVPVFLRGAPPVILHERKTSTTSTYEQNKRTKGLLTKGWDGEITARKRGWKEKRAWTWWRRKARRRAVGWEWVKWSAETSGQRKQQKTKITTTTVRIKKEMCIKNHRGMREKTGSGEREKSSVMVSYLK